MMFGIDDALIGGALSFGGKLLSGLGASSAAKKQQKLAIALQYQQDLQNQTLQALQNADRAAVGEAKQRDGLLYMREGLAAMDQFDPRVVVRDAEKAGFNPATWLSNMGSSYMSNLSTKFNTMWQGGLNLWAQGQDDTVQAITPYGKAETVSQVSPLSAIGDAVSAGSSQYFTLKDQAGNLDVKQAALGLLLDNVQKARASGNPLAGIGTPGYEHAGTQISGGGAAAALSIARRGADAVTADGYKLKQPDVTNTGLFGDTPNRGYVDAQNYEDRYGQLIGEAGGWVNAMADAYANFFPKQANPAKDYGFGTRFRPGYQDAMGMSSRWWQAAPGADTGEQVWSSSPPLFGW